MAELNGRIDGTNFPAAVFPLAQAPLMPDVPFPDSSTGSWRLLLPGTPDSLPRIREMIDEAAVRCGFSDDEIAKIEMAVDEACTNVIEHAYHALAGHGAVHPEIEIRADGYHDRLEITILDRSLHNFPINENSGMEVDEYLNDNHRRGLGLFIIRSFVDDVKHRFVEGHGNELMLVKYLA